jgi:hypothetical protein
MKYTIYKLIVHSIHADYQMNKQNIQPEKFVLVSNRNMRIFMSMDHVFSELL